MAEDVKMIRTFDGVDYEVTLDGANGHFHARDSLGVVVSAASMEGLRTRLAEADKKKVANARSKPKVRFWGYQSATGVSRYEFRGLHFGHGKWILAREVSPGRWDNVDALYFSRLKILAPVVNDATVPPEEVVAIVRAHEQAREANARVDNALNVYKTLSWPYVHGSRPAEELVEAERSMGEAFQAFLLNPRK